MSLRRLTATNSQGFTIIELMIATVVFSVMLVMATAIMINIGGLYYKGINQARVQDNVRSTSDEIAEHLQLSGGAVSDAMASPKSYCIGSTRYSFVLNKQIGTQSPHVLWRDTNPGGCPGLDVTTIAAGTPGSELISPYSRLTEFSINTTSSPFMVNIAVAYGGDDVLCNSGWPGDCTDYSGASTHLDLTATPGKILCKGDHNSSSYCSTANLNTTVLPRLPAS